MMTASWITIQDYDQLYDLFGLIAMCTNMHFLGEMCSASHMVQWVITETEGSKKKPLILASAL